MRRIYLINVHRKRAKVEKYVSAISSVFSGQIKVVEEEELAKIHGPAIITGSERMVGEGDVSEDLLNFIRNTKYPLLGICYGHQAIGKAFGHRVYKCGKHRGPEKILKIKNSPILQGLRDVFEMEESHYECVDREGELEVAAVNLEDENLVETIQHREAPIFGVQFHPEKTQLGTKTVLGNFVSLSF